MKTKPGEVIEIWPITFLGSISEMMKWQDCQVDYWGVPK